MGFTFDVGQILVAVHCKACETYIREPASLVCSQAAALGLDCCNMNSNKVRSHAAAETGVCCRVERDVCSNSNVAIAYLS